MAVDVLNLLDEGLISYQDGWERLQALVAARQRGDAPDTLLLLEHSPTITYGKTTNPAHLLLTPPEYARRGIAVVATDRGGDVTYHGPGQLVIYPIVHLGEGRRDLHRYVRLLETVVRTVCDDLGVVGAGRADWHAGIWVGEGYLAALGVRVSRWVTHHGIALNTDARVLPGFETIVPCGVPEKQVTTLSHLLSREVTPEEVAPIVAARFVEVFEAG